MVSLTTYTMRCERNRVNKLNFLDNERVITGTFRDNCNMLSPVVILELPYESDAMVIDFNYVYIEQLGRFYFVENINFLHRNLYEVYLRVDVLSSYRLEIMQQKAFIERNENDYDLELKDEREIVYPTYDIDTFEYENSFFLDPTKEPQDGILNAHTYITTIVGRENISSNDSGGLAPVGGEDNGN